MFAVPRRTGWRAIGPRERPVQARAFHERGYRGAALDFGAPIGEPQANGAYRRMLADEATRSNGWAVI